VGFNYHSVTSKQIISICLHGALYLLLLTKGTALNIPVSFVLMSLLIWISVVDFESYRIPNKASFILLITGFINLFYWRSDAAFSTILAAVFWALAFWGLATGYEKLRGKVGLGFGDVKLVSGLTIWVGFEGSISVILFSSIAGLIAILILFIWRGANEKSLTEMPIAFGPYLCFFTWVVWLQG